jgi:hypothetical protein
LLTRKWRDLLLQWKAEQVDARKGIFFWPKKKNLGKKEPRIDWSIFAHFCFRWQKLVYLKVELKLKIFLFPSNENLKEIRKRISK